MSVDPRFVCRLWLTLLKESRSRPHIGSDEWAACEGTKMRKGPVESAPRVDAIALPALVDAGYPRELFRRSVWEACPRVINTVDEKLSTFGLGAARNSVGYFVYLN